MLWVDDNHLKDLSPLKDLSLLWLSAGDNKIEDISALANSTNLHRLWLGGNQNSSSQHSKTSTCSINYTWLLMNVEDISPLAKLTSLSSLYLSHNNIQNIEPLHDLDQLHVLSNGLDHEESPLEMQRWFLHGNPIDKRTCATVETSPPAVTLLFSIQLGILNEKTVPFGFDGLFVPLYRLLLLEFAILCSDPRLVETAVFNDYLYSHESIKCSLLNRNTTSRLSRHGMEP